MLDLFIFCTEIVNTYLTKLQLFEIWDKKLAISSVCVSHSKLVYPSG